MTPAQLPSSQMKEQDGDDECFSYSSTEQEFSMNEAMPPSIPQSARSLNYSFVSGKLYSM